MALSSLRRLLHRVTSPIRSPHVLGTQPPLNRATMSIGRLPGHEDPTKWRRLPTQAPTATEMTESIADGLRGRPPWPVARGEEHQAMMGPSYPRKCGISHTRGDHDVLGHRGSFEVQNTPIRGSEEGDMQRSWRGERGSKRGLQNARRAADDDLVDCWSCSSQSRGVAYIL